ncbi:hypothetical protein [Actinopolymorpha alba]|uniref:hypothetical protein n=1 Tax=Actinopolymorpha alba TaxID=533267 RepID=UPI00036CB6F3|nr:hypothetical protein [Actinopolymorpha alba]
MSGGCPYAAEAMITATLVRTEMAIAMYVVRMETTAIALGNYVIADSHRRLRPAGRRQYGEEERCGDEPQPDDEQPRPVAI